MPKESKYHVTPESGRYAITLNKDQLKWMKKMSIDFEVPIKKILPLAVDMFIKKYQILSMEEIEQKGLKAITDD